MLPTVLVEARGTIRRWNLVYRYSVYRLVTPAIAALAGYAEIVALLNRPLEEGKAPMYSLRWTVTMSDAPRAVGPRVELRPEEAGRLAFLEFVFGMAKFSRRGEF